MPELPNAFIYMCKIIFFFFKEVKSLLSVNEGPQYFWSDCRIPSQYTCSVVAATSFEERRNNKRHSYGLCKDVAGHSAILISLFFKISLKSRMFDVEDVGFFGCYAVTISM